MLPGVTPFPPEFAARYRGKGYWEDRSIASVWKEYCRTYADRTAVIDGDVAASYAELDDRAVNLALNLLDLGIRPLDRLVLQLPNCIQFVYLYLALQKIGAIPVMALPAHRYLEISQFVQIAGAIGCVVPDKYRAFDFRALVRRIRKQQPQLKYGIVLGEASEGFVSLDDLIERPSSRNADELSRIVIDPCDPALFLLSGGTTGVPNLIPRTHNDVVPALLIRWLADPAIARYDLSSLKVIQSGGQRLQPQTRTKAQKLIPSAFIQENFGMAEGVLMFVRLDDPPEVRLETVGRPICPDDEIMLLDDDDNIVPFGEVGEFCCRGPYTLRGYYGAGEHNRRAFTKDGFYRSGDLMRQHRSGNYIVEGRKKDLINRGGEKISAEEIENLILSHPAVHNVACVPVPDPELGERMCACIVLQPGRALPFDELIGFLEGKDMARIKLPERLLILDELPLSNFGKVAKKTLSEMAAARAIARTHLARV
jgi:2,3-dihydroxybenzoate-AMP ligase